MAKMIKTHIEDLVLKIEDYCKEIKENIKSLTKNIKNDEIEEAHKHADYIAQGGIAIKNHAEQIKRLIQSGGLVYLDER